jgi:hypothetical protein
MFVLFVCLYIRIKRIYSTVETTKQRLGDLRHPLKRRVYNDKFIESGFSKGHSRMNNSEILPTLGHKTQDEDKAEYKNTTQKTKKISITGATKIQS